MAIVATPPYIYTTLGPLSASIGSVAIAAAGQSAACIGYCRLEGGAGSKTISSSGGGKIYHSTCLASGAFANAGTNYRVGVQDVSLATGLEDAAWDVYGDVTGGSGAIPATQINVSMAMTSGTKTIAHGDLIAIVGELTTRAGADSVTISRNGSVMFGIGNLLFPYGSADIGVLTKTNTPMWAMLVFDDGTIGWIDGLPFRPLVSTAASSFAYNSGSTPDEYISTFIPPTSMQVSSIGLTVGSIATTDTMEVILYSDPYGTPAVIQAVTHDPDLTGSIGVGALALLVPITPVTLLSSSTYGVALRPTSANNVDYFYYDHGNGFDKIKRASFFGANAKVASRTDQTGAFTEVQTYYHPTLILEVTGFDIGSGFLPVA